MDDPNSKKNRPADVINGPLVVMTELPSPTNEQSQNDQHSSSIRTSEMDDRNSKKNWPADVINGPLVVMTELPSPTNERSQNDQHSSSIRKNKYLLHDAERTIAFTDAIVAIAMTLLILPLMDSASEIGTKETDMKKASDFFEENRHRVMNFLLSFWIECFFWSRHSRIFGHVGQFTALLLHVNFVWVASMVFLPVATSLLNYTQEDDDKIATGVYIGTLLVTAIANLLMNILVKRDSTIWNDDAYPENPSILRDVIIILLVFTALLISLLVPGVKVFSILLLLAREPLIYIVQKIKPEWT